MECTHGNLLLVFVLLPHPQLVFEWSTLADKTDVFHFTSDDEGEDWGEDEVDQEVTTTTVPIAIVCKL